MVTWPIPPSAGPPTPLARHVGGLQRRCQSPGGFPPPDGTPLFQGRYPLGRGGAACACWGNPCALRRWNQTGERITGSPRGRGWAHSLRNAVAGGAGSAPAGPGMWQGQGGATGEDPIPQKVPRGEEVGGRGSPVLMVAAGGTGGHVFPGIAVAQALLALLGHEGELALGESASRGVAAETDCTRAGGGKAWVDSVVQFCGSSTRLESRAVPSAGFKLHTLPAPRMPTRGTGGQGAAAPPLLKPVLVVLRRLGRVWALLLLPLRVAWACACAVVLLLRVRPRVVLGTGGYVCFPACAAAVALGIPLVLQEQNAFPGRVTRLLAPFASALCLGFPEALRHLPSRVHPRCTVTGNPLREDLLSPQAKSGAFKSATGAPATPDGPSPSKAPLQHFFPDSALPAPGQGQPGAASSQYQDGPGVPRAAGPVVLCMGGSLGAAPLNSAVAGAALDLLRHFPGLHLIWQTGVQGGGGGPPLSLGAESPPSGVDAGVWQELKGHPRVVAHPFIERMDLAYAAADLAVCRAGAVTCTELLVTCTPSVLVPSPYVADNHQQRNAEALETAGCTVVVPEDVLGKTGLVPMLTALLESQTTLSSMSEAAASSSAAYGRASFEIARCVCRLARIHPG